MRTYSKLEIIEIFSSCRTLEDILKACETLKWLWALGDNISFNYVREVSVKRTRELI